MQRYLIKDILLVNEGKIIPTDVLIEGERFEKIAPHIQVKNPVTEINGAGKYMLPGVIDDQVHFREPGYTHKATIYTESRAAVAGGVTSYMEMPNTYPPAVTLELLQQKYEIAARHSLANYSFYLGAANHHLEEIVRLNAHRQEICGLKIFMGSSTGELLVDDIPTLEQIFASCELPIATHCEDESLIRQRLQMAKTQKGEALTAADHPWIRNEEVCLRSSSFAVSLAKRYGTRLHILHLTTAEEMQLFTADIPLAEKQITAEVCVHHLHFTADAYPRLGNLIKCNPAIKAAHHRDALWQALLEGRIDVIATDHAPHTWEEKQQPYLQAPAGLPLVQHGLLLMLEYYQQGTISLEKIVEKMCHHPAICFQVRERGFVREGYFADAVIVDMKTSTPVNKDQLLYKCKWSPFESHVFPASITHTFVSGHLAYADGKFNETRMGQRLLFNR
ncbi:dihydroorotase [Thermoflavifilum thermophilum]|uniref:Dihydroorotase n=1 Tax=Thermoflavifilum thermophilum TaxID=1393122 RepID=A0A1I7N4R7_9BACT|nr:dihydroorotase [Thermoflavifilum thermophilum]SFV29657.1 dihydroorotase [Thermoflavifilum thermophilum]